MNRKPIIAVSAMSMVIIAAMVYIFVNCDAIMLRYCLNSGNRYLAEGELEKAEICFSRAVDIDYMNIDAYKGLANSQIGSVNKVTATLDKAYTNTKDDAVADIYIDIADKLLSEDKKLDAYRLAKSGTLLMDNTNLNFKLSDIVWDNLKDVNWDMSKKLITDFELFVDLNENSNIILDGYDCNNDYDEREFIWAFAAEFAGFYFKDKPKFKWDEESVPNGEDYLLRVPKEQVDWVLKNYFNLTPPETIKPLDDDGIYGERVLYLEDGYYYFNDCYSHCGSYCKPIIEHIYYMGENKYYFSYWCSYIGEYDFDDKLDMQYAAYYVSSAKYAILERRNVDGIEFWSPIEAGDE